MLNDRFPEFKTKNLYHNAHMGRNFGENDQVAGTSNKKGR